MGTSKPIKTIQEDDMQLTCSECILIPKILKIDYKNFLIEYECPKHGIKQEDIKQYFESSKEFLYKNKNNSDNNNDKKDNHIFYYCLECKNFLCENCGNNHDHEKPLFIRINDPTNEDDIHLNDYNKYCICNKQLFDDQKINCKNKNNQENDDSKFLKKLKNKKKKLEEKIENEKYVNKLLQRLINMREEQISNHLNKENIIKASENIIENKSELLLKKIENLENKMSYYLENKLGIKIGDNIIELNLNGKKLCDIDLILLKKSNKDLKNLENLDLGNNDIKNIEILKELNLPNLRVLI